MILQSMGKRKRLHIKAWLHNINRWSKILSYFNDLNAQINLTTYTVSHNIDFVSFAAANGYEASIYAHNVTEDKKHIKEWKEHSKLTFLYIRTRKGTKENLGRPNVTPVQVKELVMNFIYVIMEK